MTGTRVVRHQSYQLITTRCSESIDALILPRFGVLTSDCRSRSTPGPAASARTQATHTQHAHTHTRTHVRTLLCRALLSSTTQTKPVEHEHASRLNESYAVLSDPSTRRAYDNNRNFALRPLLYAKTCGSELYEDFTSYID